MENKRSNNLIVLNRQYPPLPSITGASAALLVEYLISHYGITVDVVYVEGKYEGKPLIASAPGTRHPIKTFYSGKNKVFRLFANTWEGWIMIRKARWLLRRKPDSRIIVMTDPPLLNFWASKLLGKKNIPWAYWTMDLYPEAFVSAGLVSDKNPIYEYINKMLVRRPPDYVIALGPQQLQYLESKFAVQIPSSVLPCGIFKNEYAQKPAWRREGKIHFGYCGNLGEAHNSRFIVEFVKLLDPSKHVFIASIYGKNADRMNEELKHFPIVTFVESVPREHLQFVDVHLATLEPQWINVCVPSKLVSAICAGSTFVLLAARDCDNWILFERAGWLIEPDEDVHEKAQKILGEIEVLIEEKKANARALAEDLSAQQLKSYRGIAEYVVP